MSATKHEFVPSMPPVIPPLGPQPPSEKLYSQRQQILMLQEIPLSEFTISTIDGMDVMYSTGEALNVHGEKTFTDKQGNVIFTLSSKPGGLKEVVHAEGLKESFHAHSPEGYDFEIKNKLSIMAGKSEVLFRNASNGQDIKLEVRGNWKERHAEIITGDVCVAQVMPAMYNAKTIIGNVRSYYVAVAPNVDLSMIAAVCLAIDERERSYGQEPDGTKIPVKAS